MIGEDFKNDQGKHLADQRASMVYTNNKNEENDSIKLFK